MHMFLSVKLLYLILRGWEMHLKSWGVVVWLVSFLSIRFLLTDHCPIVGSLMNGCLFLSPWVVVPTLLKIHCMDLKLCKSCSRWMVGRWCAYATFPSWEHRTQASGWQTSLSAYTPIVMVLGVGMSPSDVREVVRRERNEREVVVERGKQKTIAVAAWVVVESGSRKRRWDWGSLQEVGRSKDEVFCQSHFGIWALVSRSEHQVVLSILMLRKISGTILTKSCSANLHFWLKL